ncbi:MAG: LysR family transcriptional regulator, partial [Lachnospiraceae bacterium]|nr:LysR family transcriptional regulator [Lachnospiraceae bacterium]
MKIFLAVCSSGCSVTAAAKELFMSQPSVTIAIRDIEEHYGVRLFDRIGRRLYLTSAGEQFRDYAQRILALQEDLDKSMEKNAVAGPIRIGASMTIGSRRM